jgi:hypothetical protein
MPASKKNKRKHNHSSGYKKAIRRLQGRVNADEILDRAISQLASEKLPDRERGLYSKYQVRRVDGSSEPGKKHAKCNYFVLDIDHDPHAAPAIFSYATSARADGYELLAGNLFAMIQPYLEKLEQHAKENLLEDIKKMPALESMSDADLQAAVANHVWSQLEGDDGELILAELLDRFQKLTSKPKRAPRAKRDVKKSIVPDETAKAKSTEKTA